MLPSSRDANVFEEGVKKGGLGEKVNRRKRELPFYQQH